MSLTVSYAFVVLMFSEASISICLMLEKSDLFGGFFFLNSNTREFLPAIAPSIHVTALKGFCQSSVVFQWKGQISQAVFLLSHCHNSIAILLNRLFFDEKTSLTKYCMGTPLLKG